MVWISINILVSFDLLFPNLEMAFVTSSSDCLLCVTSHCVTLSHSVTCLFVEWSYATGHVWLSEEQLPSQFSVLHVGSKNQAEADSSDCRHLYLMSHLGSRRWQFLGIK